MGERSYAIFVGQQGKELNEALTSLTYFQSHVLWDIQKLVDESDQDDKTDLTEFIETLTNTLKLYESVTAQVAGEIHP